ncbi:MAG: hypothetical protein PWR24_755 [Desulfonauticus sp.]|jgi:hypothetical protein|nr:hypothetical protein [Desulfonauticus sp.]
MKRLPIGISSFKEIITENYVYVDKTEFICKLKELGKYYFLSRPRRFGKTLFVDTLREVFEGNKELFKGLYIYGRWDWSRSYPVIHISFAEGVVRSLEELNQKIYEILDNNQKRLGISCEYKSFSGCFGELIEKSVVKYKNRAVILIDEYDKPILDNITDPELAQELREGLKNLYSVIKGQDANIEFVFMTGVSKFSKVSIFSGLNNLEDISVDQRYNAICGYREEDILTYFQDYLAGKDIKDIRKWYDGYSWDGISRVYNPFSVLNYFAKGEFRNYWFESGTPGFLIKLLKERNYYIPDLENLEVGESLIGSFDLDFIEPENILFQAGYLTIVGKRWLGNRLFYRLRYPNLEVKASLTDYLLKAYSFDLKLKEQNQSTLYQALVAKDLLKIKEIMQSHFSSIPYDWYRKNRINEYEGYYASVFYSYFASLGLDIVVEDSSSKGKVDMTVLMEDGIFIFEFKVLDKEPGKALAQLKARGYADKYKSKNLPLYLIGIEFDKEDKNIKEFQWEKI